MCKKLPNKDIVKNAITGKWERKKERKEMDKYKKVVSDRKEGENKGKN